MSDTLYPIFYGTRLVTFDVLRNTFEPHLHPAMARVGFNFILYHEGFFGIGGGFRTFQPDKPGFAPSGRTFHMKQQFPSGEFYTAWDTVVRNPGGVHRSPTWAEVPAQGTQRAADFGFHMNVGTPGAKGSEPWHGQPVPLDGWWAWANAGRWDLDPNYPIKLVAPDHDKIAAPIKPYVPPKAPTKPTVSNPSKKEITLNITSRYLEVGAKGSDVLFFQRLLNDVGGQGLELDGIYGGKTKFAVSEWQKFFGLFVDGELGPVTQTHIIEISLQAS